MFHFIGWMALVLQIIGIILYATTIVISTSYTDRLIRSLALLEHPCIVVVMASSC